MPIYEYECNLCHCHFEKRQKFDDDPIAICPECQGRTRRVLFPSPIIFKGNGFYITDSRNGSNTRKDQEAPSGKETKKEP